MTAVTCHGITKGGIRCRARPLVGSNYCLAHSPTISDEQRAAWRARGGFNSSAKARAAKTLPTELMSTDEIAAWLTIQYRKLIAGQLTPGVATASATVAKTIAEIQRGAQLEERMTQIEVFLDTGKRPA